MLNANYSEEKENSEKTSEPTQDNSNKSKLEKILFTGFLAAWLSFLGYQGCHDIKTLQNTGKKIYKQETKKTQKEAENEDLYSILKTQEVKFNCTDIPCLKRYLSLMQKNLNGMKKYGNYDKTQHEDVQKLVSKVNDFESVHEAATNVSALKELNEKYNSLISSFVEKYNENNQSK